LSEACAARKIRAMVVPEEHAGKGKAVTWELGFDLFLLLMAAATVRATFADKPWYFYIEILLGFSVVGRMAGKQYLNVPPLFEDGALGDPGILRLLDGITRRA